MPIGSASRPEPADRIARPPVVAALVYIHAHLEGRMSLEHLATREGLSVGHFSALFRRCVGTSPYRYVSAVRVARVRKLLDDGVSIAAAASAAGFYDQSHLTRHFKSLLGVTPGQYLLRQRRAAALT
jgi:transcriptional regulator GlxA family with amidase domain